MLTTGTLTVGMDMLITAMPDTETMDTGRTVAITPTDPIVTTDIGPTATLDIGITGTISQITRITATGPTLIADTDIRAIAATGRLGSLGGGSFRKGNIFQPSGEVGGS